MTDQVNESTEPESIETTSVSVPTPEEKLSSGDALMLERAGVKKQISLMNAQRASLENDVAELQYKNIVVQLFLRYGMTENDTIAQDGTIKRAPKV